MYVLYTIHKYRVFMQKYKVQPIYSYISTFHVLYSLFEISCRPCIHTYFATLMALISSGYLTQRNAKSSASIANASLYTVREFKTYNIDTQPVFHLYILYVYIIYVRGACGLFKFIFE